MELTINTSRFTDYLHLHKKSNRNRGSIMKRLRAKRKNAILGFNKWFEKEHDYCLPIKKRSDKSNTSKEDDEDFDAINKSLISDSISSDVSKTMTNLEKINVNNELSSCSLYAIDVTTELLKDALLENQKNYIYSTNISKDSINSSDDYVSNILNNCNQSDITPRECTPPKVFSPMDIDSDMIKLFPTLDFSTEHHLNEKQEHNKHKENKIETETSKHMDETTTEKILLLNKSFDDVSQPLQTEKVVKSDCKVKSKLTHNIQKISADKPTNVTHLQRLQLPSEQYISIFNRYQSKSKEQFIEQFENPGPLLLRDLLCGSKPKTIISPYTHRHLKPYIFRDSVTKPLWLKMLNELKEHFRRKNGLPITKEIQSIDYSYVRAKHINSVNALAKQFFWPGIDLTESLLYPDFSVIALYKNLIIGFGFMVPDISTNENYITFLFTRPHWTNCGIAKFMIYHLIQTCMTRDITLHVSVNNPAMILYQKFGFKIEEFVQNFYENYIPADSEMSKHAFFIRLRSTLNTKLN
ncbi:uncharacterized protein LOC100164814 isoform X2 [Acyrthosiphon pisum]|uniref:N-acetyltransferase domain-containing protein n=1 Tax=Acyrthosiphon pisum TaxID=7029 RepID=A0A8R2B9I1_ACYPI|nr:uncharacterized protein LOC100164814 isoform X2 [Acyrthosiphon pisum]|eukprot:XP_008187590.1 PREDICTED: uncharacterized protein LOC100164814 isoform X2 [Acyrthosiphon pisum]